MRLKWGFIIMAFALRHISYKFCCSREKSEIESEWVLSALSVFNWLV